MRGCCSCSSAPDAGFQEEQEEDRWIVLRGRDGRRKNNSRAKSCSTSQGLRMHMD